LIGGFSHNLTLKSLILGVKQMEKLPEINKQREEQWAAHYKHHIRVQYVNLFLLTCTIIILLYLLTVMGKISNKVLSRPIMSAATSIQESLMSSTQYENSISCSNPADCDPPLADDIPESAPSP